MKIRFISLTVILMFLMFGVVHAGTINLPKTGQTKCYDTAGDEIPFPGTGQDGANQAELERGQFFIFGENLS